MSVLLLKSIIVTQHLCKRLDSSKKDTISGVFLSLDKSVIFVVLTGGSVLELDMFDTKVIPYFWSIFSILIAFKQNMYDFFLSDISILK